MHIYICILLFYVGLLLVDDAQARAVGIVSHELAILALRFPTGGIVYTKFKHNKCMSSHTYIFVPRTYWCIAPETVTYLSKPMET